VCVALACLSMVVVWVLAEFVMWCARNDQGWILVVLGIILFTIVFYIGCLALPK
jgi:hypothetical protein